ncbi:Peptidyl-prolyl cis-trans isomerase D [Raoultella terrigena]|uniref:Peptidyl-prolyl cis-trans isomerase D n=1 Tax=Raoultella terrigena TaxID=577 RepID=A0A4U9D794_RAOTE|nr:Peptidyl-prolyl cis-trans isomerase D [Raoultella terrigena]
MPPATITNLWPAQHRSADVKVVETGWFGHDNLPEELNFKPVSDAIFNGGLVGENGAPGSNSDIITVDGDRAFVVRISEHKAQAVKPLAEVKAQVTDIIKHTKAEQQAKLDADKLLAALKDGKGDDAMKAAGLSFGAAQTLARTGQDPLSQAAFALRCRSRVKQATAWAAMPTVTWSCWLWMLLKQVTCRLSRNRPWCRVLRKQCSDCFRSADEQPA